jgi:hypothetical protein
MTKELAHNFRSYPVGPVCSYVIPMKTPDLHVQSHRYAMKYLFIFALICPPLFAALAPDSIAGKVYRDSFFSTALRTYGESTMIFSPDGRFVYLKAAEASTVTQRSGSGAELIQPPGDGRFTYIRTGENTARVELNYDDGSLVTMTWTFTSASTGNADRIPGANETPFLLSDLTTVQTAPTANVSMRGRVSPGQPLIVGFVVPGTRFPDGTTRTQSADSHGRDILIRVVGPSLAQFGVTGVWADPDFKIFRGNSLMPTLQWHYQDWSTITNITTRPNPGGVAAFRKIFGYVGAFPLLEGSKDAADVVRLGPGAYTVVCETVATAPGGDVLIEVYFLP